MLAVTFSDGTWPMIEIVALDGFDGSARTVFVTSRYVSPWDGSSTTTHPNVRSSRPKVSDQTYPSFSETVKEKCPRCVEFVAPVTVAAHSGIESNGLTAAPSAYWTNFSNEAVAGGFTDAALIRTMTMPLPPAPEL